MLKKSMREILNHISRVIESLDSDSVNSLASNILHAKRIFIHGVGRSGLISKCFGMRLMHLSMPVFIVGETITPAISEGDLLIVISGSGNTNSVVGVAKKAAEKAKVALVTSNSDSACASVASCIVIIPGRTKEDAKDYLADQVSGEHRSLAPMGTLFEDAAHVFLDGLIAELASRLEKSEKDMSARHANLEA